MSLPPDDHGAGDDEPGPSGGPPHPMDRVWRHPSELPPIDEPGRAGGAGDPTASTRQRGGARVRSLLAPLGAGAVGALLAVGVLAAAGVFDNDGSTSVASGTTSPGPATNEIARIARQVAPAIVAVRVFGKTGSARTGSGVCIRHAGQVLTSDRLLAGASRIEVVTADGTVKTAGIIGRDPASDLALLSIDGALEAADLAAEGSLRVGEPVYAVGADTSGTPWVSEGIVSSLAGKVATNATTMTGLIESNALTEAAVAGGALLDAKGRVAGILMTPVVGHPVTVAVPIRFASVVADSLRAHGYVEHGWLGVSGTVTAGGRLRITNLAAGGPSQKAGVKIGDIIVSADSQPIQNLNDLMAAARRHWPGDRIQIEVTRGRDALSISVLLARMPRAAPTTTAATATTTTTTTTTRITARTVPGTAP